MKNFKKQPKRPAADQLKQVDYAYYWNNGKLQYYGELPNGSQRTITCDNWDELDKLLADRGL